MERSSMEKLHEKGKTCTSLNCRDCTVERIVRETKELDNATNSGQYRYDYRYDSTGNIMLEAVFGRLAITGTVQSLQGRIMTIVDASIVDPVQRKAMNDLVKRAFSECLKRFDDSALRTPYVHEESELSDIFGTVLYMDTGETLPTN